MQTCIIHLIRNTFRLIARHYWDEIKRDVIPIYTAIGAGIDKARTVFEADYLKDHITLGYTPTVHSAHGVSADSYYAILGEGVSRAMAYVAVTRGRHNNEAFPLQQFSNEADHEHAKPVAARLSTTSAAATNIQPPTTSGRSWATTTGPAMHAEAERHLLAEMVAEVSQRRKHRRRARRSSWRAHVKTAQAWRAGLYRGRAGSRLTLRQAVSTECIFGRPGTLRILLFGLRSGESLGRPRSQGVRPAPGLKAPVSTRKGTRMDARGYPLLFGESGASLADADWIDHANKYLPANLSALKTTFVDGSRAQRSLRVSYEPGPSAFNFAQLSGGSIAEMLDQAATHCGSFVTSHPCPTLTMSVTFLRAGTAKSYVATGRLIKLTSVTAVLGADLTDDKGQLIATVSLVSQLVKDLSRLF